MISIGAIEPLLGVASPHLIGTPAAAGFATTLVLATTWLLFFLLGTCALWRARTPPELRGDWWQRFEREFRAYTDGLRAG